MSRSKKFFGGLRLGYLYQATVMVFGLWITPFLLKHLGQHDYGLWLVGLQTLSYMVLMDFGIVALLPRATAYATGHAISGAPGGDLAETIGRSARIVLYQTPVVFVGGAVLWLVVPMGPAIRGPLLIAVLGFAFLFPLRIFQAVLHGLQETPYLGKLQFFSWIVSTGLMVILIQRGFGLYSLAIGWVTGQFVPVALCFYRLKTAFPGVLPSRLPKMSRQEVFTALTSGTWVSVAQIAQVLVAGTDLVIIGKFLGPAAVVPYACTGKLISVLQNQPQMIMEMAAPGLSQMKTSENCARIFRACSALSIGLLTASGLVAVVTLAVNHSFVSWWLRQQPMFSGQLMTALMVTGMLLRHWNHTSVYTIFALGHERRLAVTTLLDGAVAVLAGILLVWRLGPIGAAMGSIVGVCLISLPGNLRVMARELQLSVFTVVSSIWPWCWRFLIVAALMSLLGLRWRPNLAYIVGTSCVAAALYGAVMSPMIMDSPLRPYLPVRVTKFWDQLLGRFSWAGVSNTVGQPAEAPKNS